MAYEKPWSVEDPAGLSPGTPLRPSFDVLPSSFVEKLKAIFTSPIQAFPIEQIDGLPIVGQVYSVPCLIIGIEMWPVFEPAHTDALYFPHAPRHHHYDLRFLTVAQIAEITAKDAVDRFKGREHLVFGYGARAQYPVARQNLKCLRQMPDFPVSQNQMLAAMENDYAASKVDLKCRRCPHRGTPLTGLPIDPAGNVVCPAHGLKFNLNTGVMVPRITGGGHV